MRPVRGWNFLWGCWFDRRGSRAVPPLIVTREIEPLRRSSRLRENVQRAFQAIGDGSETNLNGGFDKSAPSHSTQSVSASAPTCALKPCIARRPLCSAGDVEPEHQRRIRGPQRAYLRAVALLSQAWHHQVFKLGRRIVANSDRLEGARSRTGEGRKGRLQSGEFGCLPAGRSGGFDGPLFEQPESPIPVKTIDRPDAVTRKKVLGTVRSPKRRTGRDDRARAPLPTYTARSKNDYDS